MDRIEGSGASQLVQLIRALGYNVEISIELATVTAAPPDLKIKVDHMNVELEKDDLIVAQALTRHKRRISLKSEGKTNISSSAVKIGYVTAVAAGPYPVVGLEAIKSAELSSANQTIEEAELEFLDELQAGERVIVAGIQQGQAYIVLDRAVTS